jgi:hypothetical protein
MSSNASSSTTNEKAAGALQRPSLFLNGGDSAAALRALRNGARAWGQQGKKMGGGCKISGYGTLFPAAHLFPPSLADSAHHSAANAVSERNLLRKITKTHQKLQRKKGCET